MVRSNKRGSTYTIIFVEMVVSKYKGKKERRAIKKGTKRRKKEVKRREKA